MKIQYRIPQKNSQYVNAGCREKAIRVATIGSCSYIYEMDLNSSAFVNGEYMRQSLCVGKYAVLGKDIRCIQDLNSDYNSLYQGVIVPFAGDPWRNGNGQIMKRTAQKGEILIGNDVCIGDGVTILGGVRIGDGAVVAAGTVVVKDIPPYAVVGGNPAKIIRYRFPQDVIQKLCRIQWWDWDEDQMLARKEDMQGEVAAFAEKYDGPIHFYPRKSGNYIPFLANEPTVRFLHFMDFRDPSSVYTEIVKNFIETYAGKKAELILCYNAYDQQECRDMEALVGILNDYGNLPILINVCGIAQEEDEEKVMSEADYYITNRHARVLQRVHLADKYRVPILSGVNLPIFPEILPQCREEFVIKQYPTDLVAE